MFGKEFLHQVCLFATIFFPYSFPIEIKETSVGFMFLFFKRGTMVCAFAKKMEVRKVSKESVANVFS
jgi:hypothetical protein